MYFSSAWYYSIGLLKFNSIQKYILASVFFEKDDKYVFKARNSCCV